MIETKVSKKSPVNFDGYFELWIEVINKAVNDYRLYPYMRSEITRFFKSEYFENMTGVSGKVVVDRLKKENNKN